MEKCRILREYSIFVDMVRQKKNAGMELEQAVKETIVYCKKHDILSEYLEAHELEVYDMLNFEWNMDEAKKAWQDEASELRAVDVAEKCLDKNMDHVLISELTSLSLEKVERLAKARNSVTI